jgi:hypothetical protein
MDKEIYARLQAEFDELEIKCDKLLDYIVTSGIANNPYILLETAQYEAMIQYRNTLIARLEAYHV